MDVVEESKCNPSHKDASAFVFVILSHGVQGHVYGTDGHRLSIDSILEAFDGINCPHLAGKPKMFIILACQGGKRLVK